MSTDLVDLPFDHYQRYGAAARAVQALDGIGSVLEVGANRQQILSRFLPGIDVVYSDVEMQPGTPGFIVASATQLPFADASFDAVVCLDVVEHMPAGDRVTAIREMARVATRLLIVACPLDLPWVHEAEALANEEWRAFFGEAYPWLEEHQEHGLVDPQVVADEMARAGLSVIRHGHGDAALWARLMAAHFAKEAASELAPAVAALDRLYNMFVFYGDRGEFCYREVFAGAREPKDVESLRNTWNHPVASDMNIGPELGQLASALPRVASRVTHAEREWRETSEQLQQEREEKQRLGVQLHEAGVELRRAMEDAVIQLRRADQADRNTETARRDLRHALDEWQATMAVLEAAQTEKTRLQQQLEETKKDFERATLDGLTQLHRADEADRKTLAAMYERDQARQELAACASELEHSRVLLQESRQLEAAAQEEVRKLQEKADTALAKLVACTADLEHGRERVRTLENDLEALQQDHDSLHKELENARGDALRLLARVRGLERRQRIALAAGIFAVISASIALAVRFAS